MSVFNYCPNPSFEAGTAAGPAGYTPLAGSELYVVDTKQLSILWTARSRRRCRRGILSGLATR